MYTVDESRLFIEQRLPKAAREHLMSFHKQFNDMRKEWTVLLDAKLKAIRMAEEDRANAMLFAKRFDALKGRKSIRKKKGLAVKPYNAKDYDVRFNEYNTFFDKTALVCRCIDEVVADLQRNREDMPWFESLPCMDSKAVGDYVRDKYMRE